MPSLSNRANPGRDPEDDKNRALSLHKEFQVCLDVLKDLYQQSAAYNPKTSPNLLPWGSYELRKDENTQVLCDRLKTTEPTPTDFMDESLEMSKIRFGVFERFEDSFTCLNLLSQQEKFIKFSYLNPESLTSESGKSAVLCSLYIAYLTATKEKLPAADPELRAGQELFIATRISEILNHHMTMNFLDNGEAALDPLIEETLFQCAKAFPNCRTAFAKTFEILEEAGKGNSERRRFSTEFEIWLDSKRELVFTPPDAANINKEFEQYRRLSEKLLALEGLLQPATEKQPWQFSAQAITEEMRRNGQVILNYNWEEPNGRKYVQNLVANVIEPQQTLCLLLKGMMIEDAASDLVAAAGPSNLREINEILNSWLQSEESVGYVARTLAVSELEKYPDLSKFLYYLNDLRTEAHAKSIKIISYLEDRDDRLPEMDNTIFLARVTNSVPEKAPIFKIGLTLNDYPFEDFSSSFALRYVAGVLMRKTGAGELGGSAISKDDINIGMAGINHILYYSGPDYYIYIKDQEGIEEGNMQPTNAELNPLNI